MMDSVGNESFWKKLGEGSGGFRFPRVFFILIFLGGTVFFAWSFNRITELGREEPIFAPPVPPQAQEDEKRLEELIENYRSAIEARQGSRSVADSVVGGKRRPFAVSARKGSGAGAAEAAVDLSTAEAPIEEVLPPIMFVRAIMSSGGESIAIMDINGVGNGIIVKRGYSFLEKKGRIVKITPDKVTVRWVGRDMDVAPGF